MYHTLADRDTNPLDQWARWQPSGLPSYGFGGIYEIYVRAPSPNATTWQAPYVIKHQVGTSQAVVDQLGLSNQWVSIGTYRMKAGDYVYTHDATGEISNQHCTGWCQLGVDAVKFVRRGIIFAPDITYGNGWSHTVTLRSNGGEAKTIVNFLKEDGSVLCSTSPTLPAHSTQTFTCNSTNVASLVVDGSQDLSVVVLNRYNGSQVGETRVTDYNGIASGGLDVGWNQTGTTLWAPALKHSLYGRSGQVYLLNTGAVATSISITLRAQDNGASYTCTPIASLGPGARTSWTPAACGAVDLPVNKLYGAQFTASAAQPLAAVVVEENDGGDGGIATTNLFRMGGAVNYAPVVKHSFWNHSATIVVQNSGAVAGDVTAVYRDRDDNYVYTQTINLGPGSSSIFTLADANAPTNMIAAARIAAAGNVSMVTTMYENRAGSNWRMQSNGFTAGSQTVILPRLYRATTDAVGLAWTSGFQVQNVGNGAATIQLQYYDGNGNPLTVTHTPVGALPVAVGESVTYNLAQSSLPANFVGSAVVTASQPIVVTVNATASGAATLDASMSYNGVNR